MGFRLAVLQLVPRSSSARRAPRFKDLRVRPKLIVLHNLFFLVLAGAVYYALTPIVDEQAIETRRREAAVLGSIFLEQRAPLPAADLEPEDRAFGSAEELGLRDDLRRLLLSRPGEALFDPEAPELLYRYDPGRDEFSRLRVSQSFYRQTLLRARAGLFLVLGVIYAGAVLLLELVIMPRYVYRPIRATLRADRAAQEGDRSRELIPEDLIPGDEIGDIMRSRNATVASLREKETGLEQALARLEELAQDLQRKNEELASARHSMAVQDRLATLGLLSASVAHEMNTPLAVLRGSIEKLLETVGEPAARARLERVRRMSDRLRRISESLLDFSSARRAGRKAPVEIRELLDEAWSLVALDTRAAKVAFRNEIEAEERVFGDYDRLMQVFVNLLRNGVYAIDGEGSICVRSERNDQPGRNFVAVLVEDNGPGIPQDLLPDIFEAFVSTRLDSRGTGLGLTVAEGIVQQHGGEIIADNRPEGGARVEVRLPAA